MTERGPRSRRRYHDIAGLVAEDFVVEPIVAPPRRGRLWYDFQIVDEFLGGLPTIKAKVRWVREHLPRDQRIKIGGASAWYDADIVAWLDARRGI